MRNQRVRAIQEEPATALFLAAGGSENFGVVGSLQSEGSSDPMPGMNG
jgi:hypothetical protein